MRVRCISARPIGMSWTIRLVLTILMLAPTLALAQNPQRSALPPRPTPHWPDGRLNLGAPPGETGLWAPAGIVQVSLNPKSVNRAGANTHLPNNIKIEDVPFQPWARALHEAREAAFESDEPHTRCKSSGGPRQFITPYGVEFVDMPEQKRMFIFDIGGPHSFRVIYMDNASLRLVGRSTHFCPGSEKNALQQIEPFGI